MDRYLKPLEFGKRLKEEYIKYGGLVVAYDFDSTVYDFHKVGDTHQMVIGLLQNLKQIGCTLICWTANEDLDFVASYLDENNIPHDAINENPSFFQGSARKIYYNVLLDDRAGLSQVFYELQNLIYGIKQDKLKADGCD